MKQKLTDITLEKLSAFIADKLALYFPEARWDDLERNITYAAAEFGFENVENFVQHIINSPLTRNRSELLASHLTINETYFWRETPSFDALQHKIIPELIRLRRNGEKRIRIWSAGCSGGEEPYSIAIALRRVIPDIDTWNITILANDISPKILQKATAGIYSSWSFRNTPSWLKSDYFVAKNNSAFEILPTIKKMVTFEYLNLAEDVFPSSLNNTNAMDVIFCRNVLMYFSPERVKQAVQGLFNSLVEGGYLIVGASELFYQNFPQFVPVNFEGGIIYRKPLHPHPGKKTITPFELPPQKKTPQVIRKPLPEVQQKTYTPTFFKEETKEPPKVEGIKITPKPEDERQKKYEEALQLFSRGEYAAVVRAFGKYASTSEDCVLLIRAYANQGKLKEAISHCEKAISLDKLNPTTHYLYATILLENHEDAEAIASLKRAIYLDPDFVLSYFALGNIFLRQGNLAFAKKYYKNVLSILDKGSQDEILPESEGLTVGRLQQIVNSTIQARGL